MPDAEIGARLGIPADSIGPARSRCPDKLPGSLAIAALINAEAETASRQVPGQTAAHWRR